MILCSYISGGLLFRSRYFDAGDMAKVIAWCQYEYINTGTIIYAKYSNINKC